MNCLLDRICQYRRFSLLYEFLTGTLENMEIPTDLFIEIFQMFKRLKGEVVPLPSPQRIKSRNDRWETGLDEEVREVRDENKERMLHLLIQKIENRKSRAFGAFSL